MQMSDKNVEKIGKYMSYLLRHHPEDAGLDMDSHGWVSSDALVEAVQTEYPDIPFDLDVLCELVASNDKKRYSFPDDGCMFIRANQGHSFHVDLDLLSVEPPEILYHGTADRFVDSIMCEGLLPQSRTHVHLSPDYDTAVEVGKRHGRPQVLVVRAYEMWEDGFEFFLSENGVWLVERVPVVYIEA